MTDVVHFLNIDIFPYLETSKHTLGSYISGMSSYPLSHTRARALWWQMHCVVLRVHIIFVHMCMFACDMRLCVRVSVSSFYDLLS